MGYLDKLKSTDLVRQNSWPRYYEEVNVKKVEMKLSESK